MPDTKEVSDRIEFFTGRHHFAEMFKRVVASTGDVKREVLSFYGLGAIGKTQLLRELRDQLLEDESWVKLPCAYAEFSEKGVDKVDKEAQDILLRLRNDFRRFSIPFERFDYCLDPTANGGSPKNPVFIAVCVLWAAIVPLLALYTRSDPARWWLPVVYTSTGIVYGLINVATKGRNWAIGKFIRSIGSSKKAAEVDLLLAEKSKLEALRECFLNDLAEALNKKQKQTGSQSTYRAVVFLDAYERRWLRKNLRDAEIDVAHQEEDKYDWVVNFAIGLMDRCYALLVIGGREKLLWISERYNPWSTLSNPKAHHEVVGLEAWYAQEYLSKRGIGPAPSLPAPVAFGKSPAAALKLSPLQSAIIRCCNDTRLPIDRAVEQKLETMVCHTMALAICADTVNNAEKAGRTVEPDSFAFNYKEHGWRTLLARFLDSLPPHLERWVARLSLTPRFDEKAALALGTMFGLNAEGSDWRLLLKFSFVISLNQTDDLPAGFFQFHPLVQDALRLRLAEGGNEIEVRRVHEFWSEYWSGTWKGFEGRVRILRRDEPRLAFYHDWVLEPEKVLTAWQQKHEAALKVLDITGKDGARALLDEWSEVALGESDRDVVGDEAWAATHTALGRARYRTPHLKVHHSFDIGTAHFRQAFHIYDQNATYIRPWVQIQIEMQLYLLYYSKNAVVSRLFNTEIKIIGKEQGVWFNHARRKLEDIIEICMKHNMWKEYYQLNVLLIYRRSGCEGEKVILDEHDWNQIKMMKEYGIKLEELDYIDWAEICCVFSCIIYSAGPFMIKTEFFDEKIKLCRDKKYLLGEMIILNEKANSYINYCDEKNIENSKFDMSYVMDILESALVILKNSVSFPFDYFEIRYTMGLIKFRYYIRREDLYLAKAIFIEVKQGFENCGSMDGVIRASQALAHVEKALRSREAVK